MLKALHNHDPNLATLSDRHGDVLVSPLLQGRIFCALGGELIHRLDTDRMRQPLPDEFNNLGGNSLWPAPEGGPFAFNYGPDSTQWVVQDGIAKDVALLTARSPRSAVLEKTVALVNRKGLSLRLRWKRSVELMDLAGDTPGDAVKSIGYIGEDILEPLGRHTPDELLLAAWSLEQFPGGDGVTAFAKVDVPRHAINTDFYGEPGSPPAYGKGHVTLALGGRQKFQIGIRISSRPHLLGALDRRRSLLMLRQTEPQEGRYFNIADNDQPRGPWSEADLYSVFSGGDLNFFELETIGAMQTDGAIVRVSRLVSKTMIFRGPVELLTHWLQQRHGIAL
jgi:hypothetical protein